MSHYNDLKRIQAQVMRDTKSNLVYRLLALTTDYRLYSGKPTVEQRLIAEKLYAENTIACLERLVNAKEVQA